MLSIFMPFPFPQVPPSLTEGQGCHCNKLSTAANKHRQEHRSRRSSEDITMNQFPSVIFLDILLQFKVEHRAPVHPNKNLLVPQSSCSVKYPYAMRATRSSPPYRSRIAQSQSSWQGRTSESKDQGYEDTCPSEWPMQFPKAKRMNEPNQAYDRKSPIILTNHSTSYV